MSYQYKNDSEYEQNLIGFGVVAPGAIIETDEHVENPNFSLQASSVPVEAPVEPEPVVLPVEPVTENQPTQEGNE